MFEMNKNEINYWTKLKKGQNNYLMQDSRVFQQKKYFNRRMKMLSDSSYLCPINHASLKNCPIAHTFLKIPFFDEN